MSVGRPIWVGVILALLFGPLLGSGKAGGQEIIKMAVLPFRLHAADPEKVKDWPERVRRTLLRELGREEQIILAEEGQVQEELRRAGVEEPGEELARDIGRLVDADYVVDGSITQVDGTISLDARILDIRLGGVLGYSFASGRELEPAARQLAREVAQRALRKELITQILVEGNRAVEESAIRVQIKEKVGDVLSSRAVREDLRAIYELGYFQDVRVEKRDWGRGKALVFIVEEKPVIREIRFSGNKALKTNELIEAAGLKPRSILNLNLLKEAANKILKKYHEDAYYGAEVNFEVQPARRGEVNVLFKIEEHQKIYIRKIGFSGNRFFSDERLRKLLPETEEKGLLSFVTKAGVYKEDILERDLDAILLFYYQRGFIQAKVGKPQVAFDRQGITITIPVEEGRQYKVGAVDIQGDLIAPKADLLKLVDIYPGEVLNRDKVRESVSRLTDRYADQGYALVDVSPQTVMRPEGDLMDLTFRIHQGKEVYFERIHILGNTKTRDKVIRRELQMAEGERYSLTGLKRSRENLNRLGFFKEVNLTTKKGSAEDKLDLNVQVEEGPTGSVSVGGGYSSIDQFVAMLQISQNNLFGRGQRLMASGQLGAVSQYYNLSFTEPWLFDTRISAGADLYRLRRIYEDYTVLRTGGGVRFGFPIFEEVRGYTTYRYETVNISDVLDTASIIIQEQKGDSTTSSLSAALRRDTRNHFFDPTAGSDNALAVEYAGGPLGGTNYFTKYSANSAWFYTPFWKLTFMLHGRISFLQPNAGRPIPLYERFRLGGINSVRGFKAWTIGPKASNGEVIGGDKELLFNLEGIFPLVPSIKLKGLVFFDAGNAYDVGEPYSLSALRTSVGVGVRWISPVGPLRLEWGYNLSPREGEQKSGWEFSIGTFF